MINWRMDKSNGEKEHEYKDKITLKKFFEHNSGCILKICLNNSIMVIPYW